ncbi:hypothetical protein PSTT_10809 [Puccinia striiformis]|uniref:BED-type domain-containing protein n=1 Tax=Puccinia striiformis TaxID=27350 RepID=A0A2S4V2V1_9BASI|nr:hypothetical protein PSTT_10809 [Puccinia striiformis]
MAIPDGNPASKPPDQPFSTASCRISVFFVSFPQTLNLSPCPNIPAIFHLPSNTQNVHSGTNFQARRSSRISTPMKRAGMIQPLPDSRRSMVQELPLAQRDSGSNGHSRKRKEILTDSDAPNSEPVDLAQDSDEENSNAKKKQQRRDPEFNDPQVFFSEPFCCKEDPENKPAQTYTCLWCSKEVRVSGSSLSNLRTHRDEKVNIGQSRGTITNHFAPTEKFDNQTFNQIITLWLLQQAILWSQVEDPYLQAAFHYCEAEANLFRRKWAATSAQTVYLDLQDAMINRLKGANSKFNLIHDVWTTKGNRFGFIGASVSFIDADWNVNKNQQATNRNQSNELNELTKALDFVVKKITSSCIRRQEFERRAADFDQRAGIKKLKGLIAGYGIRWNIKYQSRKQGLQGKRITAKDWMLIDELNRELKPFNRLTKIMEGDGPTGAFVLPNYYQTISNLKQRRQHVIGDMLCIRCLSK